LRLTRAIAIFVLLSGSAATVGVRGQETASLILTAGRVWTGNPAQPWAEAVAVRGERIAAVGTDAAIGSLAGPTTRRVDLRGRFVMPGINDAHVHFGSTPRLTQVDLNDAASIEEMQRRVAAFAKENPQLQWIQGYGWQYSNVPGGMPHRSQLDAVVPGRPVFLSAYDGHSGWANSKALEIAGVTAETRFEGYGEIVRDAEGRPTGAFKEGAQSLIRSCIPKPTIAERLEALRRGMRLMASLGVTSIQNADGDIPDLELYRELQRRGELTLRVMQTVSVGPKTTPQRLEEIAEFARRNPGPMLRAGSIKILVDGVIESHTAAMLAPYSDDAGTSAQPSWSRADLGRVVEEADRLGLQVWIHAIGDGGVRMALDAYERARRVNGASGSRHRIEHIEVVAAEDIPRFAALGVMASMEPIHADPGTSDVWSKAVGPERERLGFAWHALERAGARLVFSSDWPAAISIDPMRGLHCAVTRQTVEGKPPGGWYPEQRVSVQSALSAYTAAGAYASFEEKIKGTLEPGKLADLIVLNADPFEVKPLDLYRCRVELTVFNGRVVFDRAATAAALRSPQSRRVR